MIAADGEFQASERLREAAAVMAQEPVSVQLRFFQTLAEISVEKNSTIVLPFPMDLLKGFPGGVAGPAAVVAPVVSSLLSSDPAEPEGSPPA